MNRRTFIRLGLLFVPHEPPRAYSFLPPMMICGVKVPHFSGVDLRALPGGWW